jgi:hypothetical protein
MIVPDEKKDTGRPVNAPELLRALQRCPSQSVGSSILAALRMI